MGRDDAKRMILARRARFLAATLASVAATTAGVATGVEACGGEPTNVNDRQPEPCLGVTCDRPQGCSEPIDSGSKSDTSTTTTTDGSNKGDVVTTQDSSLGDAADADPKPCLTPPLKDADPIPCLAPPL